MGIRNKRSGPDQHADTAEARHSLDEAFVRLVMGSTQHAEQNDGGRKVALEDQPPSKSAAMDRQPDDAFEAACLALVIAERKAEPRSSEQEPLPVDPADRGEKESSRSAYAQRTFEALSVAVAKSKVEVAELRGIIAQRATVASSKTEALRQSLLDAEAQREAQVAELTADLSAASQREASAQREAEALRQTMNNIDSQHQVEVAESREILTQREIDSNNQIESLHQSLLHAEAQRRADATELSTELSAAAQRVADATELTAAAQREIELLRQTMNDIEARHEVEVAESHEVLAQREIDALNQAEALRQSLLDAEAQRAADAAELTTAAQREVESLRQTMNTIVAQHEAEVAESREIFAQREEILAQREIDALNQAEALRQSLLDAEAQRAADAESFVTILAQREANT